MKRFDNIFKKRIRLLHVSHRNGASNGLRNDSAGRRGKPGFTLMEILVALTVLSLTLMSIYQSFANTVFINQATQGLWKAMVFADGELAKLERGPKLQVEVRQGEYPESHPMSGFRWLRDISDEEPFPGVRARKVVFELSWGTLKGRKTFRTQTYVQIPK